MIGVAQLIGIVCIGVHLETSRTEKDSEKKRRKEELERTKRKKRK